MYAKWCTMSNLAVPISRLYDFMDWILCSDDCWLVQTWQMLCGLKTILTDMNILNSYRHIRPKKVKYPIPEIPDDSGKKSGTDWVLPKIIGSGRVSGTRQALFTTSIRLEERIAQVKEIQLWNYIRERFQFVEPKPLPQSFSPCSRWARLASVLCVRGKPHTNRDALLFAFPFALRAYALQI